MKATREQVRAIRTGLIAAVLLAVLIFAGSHGLRHIDAALVGYTFACLFAAFAIAYRYSMWLQRPPTRQFWRRGWQAFLRRGRTWKRLRVFASRFPAHSSSIFSFRRMMRSAAPQLVRQVERGEST